MNEEYNGKHSYNLHLDKQIQIKLLEADEDIVTKESNLILLNLNSKNNFAISSNDTTVPNWIHGQWCSSSKNYNANSSNSNTYCSYFNQQPGRNVNSQDLCGWFVHPKVGLLKRKTENDATSKSKVNSALNNRDVLLSRTTKKGPPEFVFKHYSDSKCYIEQYREEHTYCATPKSVVKTTVSPKSFYPCEYEQMVSQDNAQSVSILPFVQNEKTITNTEQHNLSLPSSFLSINKREKQNVCASFPNKFQQHYKFSKPFTKTLDNFNGYRADETDTNYSKNSCFDGYLARQERSMSTPTITGVSLQKAVASKVIRPSSSSRISISNVKQTSPENGSLYDGVLTNQFMSRKIGSPSNNQPRAVDYVAAANVGERQQSDLPFHKTNRRLVNEALEERCPSQQNMEPYSGLDTSDSISNMTITKTSHLKSYGKVNNTETLVARKSDWDTTALTQGKDCEPYQTCFSELILDMNSMMKRSAGKPPFGIGQQLAMPPHTGLTTKNRGKRKILGTVCRQLKSAPWEEARTKPDEPTSGVDLIKIQGSFGNEGGMSDVSPLAPVPYFKFWNSSLPPKSSGGLKRSSSEIALQHLAEIVLAGEQDSRDRGLAEATNQILQQRRSLKDNDTKSSGISGLGETNKNKEISQSYLPSGSRQTSRILPQPHLTIICKDRGLEEESQSGSPNMAASPLSPTCHSLRATRTSTGRITGISHVYKGTSYSTALRHLNETADPDQGTLSIEGGNCLFSKGFMGGKCRIRGQEDPVLLSHQRRVQHLIEQSRLRSRFGHMISKTDSICPKSYLEIASLRINNIPWSEEESQGIFKNELADANGLSYVDNIKSGVKETPNKSSFECVSKINHPFAKGFNTIDNYQHGKDNEADGVSCAVRYTAPKLVDTDIFPSHIRIDYSYKALPILYGEAILSKPVESLPPSDKLASTRQKPFPGSLMADVPTKVNIGVPRLKYSAASPVAPSQSLNI